MAFSCPWQRVAPEAEVYLLINILYTKMINDEMMTVYPAV